MRTPRWGQPSGGTSLAQGSELLFRGEKPSPESGLLGPGGGDVSRSLSLRLSYRPQLPLYPTTRKLWGQPDSALPNHSQREALKEFSSVCLAAQTVKNLPAMRETWVPSLGLQDPLAKGKGNPVQSSRLENPADRGAWRGYSPRGRKGSDTTERLTLSLLQGAGGDGTPRSKGARAPGASTRELR